MTLPLFLALLTAFAGGFILCFILFLMLGRRMQRTAPAAPAAPVISTLRVRHDVHHHGLPTDDSGEDWKRN